MQKSQEYARQRDALDNVSLATAVITNPTHFAVALKYTAGQAVPGGGYGRPLAQQIIERAKEARVTTLRIPMLARKPISQVRLAAKSLKGLYNAVAVILAYVFRIDSGEHGYAGLHCQRRFDVVTLSKGLMMKR